MKIKELALWDKVCGPMAHRPCLAIFRPDPKGPGIWLTWFCGYRAAIILTPAQARRAAAELIRLADQAEEKS